ncbi:MAG TPA: hypothetical protein PLQ85_11015 [Anaerolineae bacterium]|nr:hypothetical protein [Anaerolineae bacterium]
MTTETKTWLAFAPDTPEATARAVFAARYGHEAVEARHTGGALLLGPLAPPTPPAETPPAPTQLSLF